MFLATAGFKVKGNSAGSRNWTAVRLAVGARGMDAPSQCDNTEIRLKAYTKKNYDNFFCLSERKVKD